MPTPDRRTRRTKGKSDSIDAIAAARATLAGTAMGAPKTRTGPVEAIRALRVARQGAVKARTAAINQMRGLVSAAPEGPRAQLTRLSAAVLVSRCTALTIDPAQLRDPEQATAAALAGLARRITALTEEITTLDQQLAPLVRQAAPRTSALFGVGADVAAHLLTTAGDNPDRLRSEAALAQEGPGFRRAQTMIANHSVGHGHPETLRWVDHSSETTAFRASQSQSDLEL